MNKGDCGEVQGRFGHICRTGAVGLQALRDDQQKNHQHHVECHPLALPKVAQPLRNRQHPLAHRQAREDVIAHPAHFSLGYSYVA